MIDLYIENESGSVYVEEHGPDKGALIYIEFKIIDRLPPNHITLNEQELTKLAKWIVGRLNEEKLK